MLESEKKPSLLARLWRKLVVLAGAAILTLVFFLALPLVQAMGEQPEAGEEITQIDTGEIPPPPPPPEEEQVEEEPEPEEPPPEIAEEIPLLDLSQLELAFEPGLGSGALGGSLDLNLGQILEASSDVDAMFALGGAEQAPRPIHDPGPVPGSKARAVGKGRVTVIFIVNKDGRVTNPKVKQSTHPAFEQPALNAIKQWRFEPGRRDGQVVEWHTSQTFQF